MPTSYTSEQLYHEYLEQIANPDNCNKLVKLEFLNPDNTVAFALDNNYKRRYNQGDSRAFIQDGDLNVSLNNGQRRKASVMFENMDGAFDYNVNKLWAGSRVRLSMGIRLKSGMDYYLPQGIFYFNDPQINWSPNQRTATYSLTDKWSYLDGSLFGNLESTYEIPIQSNIFSAMQAILRLSRFTHNATTNITEMIDNVSPVFTSFYNTRSVTINGQSYPMSLTPQTLSIDMSGSYADVLLKLNDMIVGWIGYDETGALRVDASQEDLNDLQKPVLWDYTVNGKTFFDFTESASPTEVYNDIIVWGETLDGAIVGARATNRDPTSDTNANMIGLKTYTESSGTNYTGEQCAASAEWTLKRKTVLQKSVTFTSAQLFHLRENNLVTVARTDKEGSPIERHLIQSYSIPLDTTSPMTITATSVYDYPNVDVKILDLSQGVT